MLKTCCPACRSRFKIPEKALGKKGICPKCSTQFVIRDVNNVVTVSKPKSSQQIVKRKTDKYEDILGQAEVLKPDEKTEPAALNSPQPGITKRDTFSFSHSLHALRKQFQSLAKFQQAGIVIIALGVMGISIIGISSFFHSPSQNELHADAPTVINRKLVPNPNVNNNPSKNSNSSNQPLNPTFIAKRSIANKSSIPKRKAPENIAGRWGKVHDGLPAIIDFLEDGKAELYINSRPFKATFEKRGGSVYLINSPIFPGGTGTAYSHTDRNSGRKYYSISLFDDKSVKYSIAQFPPARTKLRLIRQVNLAGDTMPDVLEFGDDEKLTYQYFKNAFTKKQAQYRKTNNTLSLMGISYIGTNGRPFTLKMDGNNLVHSIANSKVEIRYTRINPDQEIVAAIPIPKKIQKKKHPKNYGPLIKGNAYLLLGEWNLGQPKKVGLPGRIAFLENGQVIVSREVSAKEAKPEFGTYKVFNNNHVEIKSSLFPNGSLTAKFGMNQYHLILKDVKDSKSVRSFERSYGGMRMMETYPKIGRVKRKANGEISLFRAMRSKLIEIRMGKQLGKNQYEIFMKKTSKAYPGQLWITLEPGTHAHMSELKFKGPLGNGTVPFLLVSAVQTGYKAFEDQPINRLVLYDRGNAKCRITLYPLYNFTNQIPNDKWKGNLYSFNSDRWLKLDKAKNILQKEYFDRHDPHLAKAMEVVAWSWMDPIHTSHEMKYTKLPASVEGWPQSVNLVKKLLQIEHREDSKEASLIGLWRSYMKNGSDTTGLPSRLILQNDQQFTLLYPFVDQNNHGIRGTWKHSGSEIVCTVLPQEETDTGFIEIRKKISQKKVIFKFHLVGDDLRLIEGLHGGRTVTLKRQIWITGQP